MAYAFTFDAYDKSEADEEGYNPGHKRSVDVTVIAETEDKATEAVRLLITRQIYRLQEITELTEAGIPAKTTRW